MRRSTPLKALPSQELCLFCAFRLSSEASTRKVPSYSKRWITSTRQTSQPAGAAAARRVDQDEELQQRNSENYGGLFSGAATISPPPPPSSRTSSSYGGLLKQTSRPMPPRPTQVQGYTPNELASDLGGRANDNRPLYSRYSRRGPSTPKPTSYQSPFRVQVQDGDVVDRGSNDPFLKREASSGWKWLGVRKVETDAPTKKSGINPINQQLNGSPNRTLQPSDGGFVSFSKQELRTCHICRQPGHLAAQCPQRGRNVSWRPADSRIESRMEPNPQQRDAVGDQPSVPTAPSSQPHRPDERGGKRRDRGRASRWAGEEEDDRDRNRARYVNRRRWQDDDYDDNVDVARIEAKQQRKREKQRSKAIDAANQAEEAATQVNLPEHISVANLASLLQIRGEDLLNKMGEMGYSELSFDHVLNSENACLIAMELGFEPTTQSQSSKEGLDLQAAPLPTDISSLPPRPPVVTIMGHVDHGKTTLLDYLRKSSITASEHGGITQHIGAFVVPLPHHDGKTITFLDTPGHAAFLSMRQRGANVTDIVILVVAADDSVMPQTVEAINHAKAAGVPIIVAINKCDKEDADPQRVMGDLARHGVEVEDYGGDVQAVKVSGKTGLGMRELEEEIVTLSEVLEKKAPTDGVVEGWVLEASTKRSGRVATVLVRRGTLRNGDVIVAGTAWARVRSLRNEFGVAVGEASPGTPVEVDGWRGEPGAGDEVLQAPNEDKASDVVEYRESVIERKRLADDMEAINAIRKLQQEKRHREEAAERAKKLSGWDVYGGEEADAVEDTSTRTTEVPFIIKADVAGSTEAVVNAISAVGNNEVRAKILRSGVGAVSEFDVEHASVAEGHIIAFNTRVDPSIKQKAAQEGVKIVDQSIIYRVTEDVIRMLSEKLPDKIIQSVTGEAEIAQIFSITVSGRKKMQIAGCKVRNGVIKLGSMVRVLRGTETVYDGKLASLKSVKKDVTEMRKDTECGMGFREWEDFQVGDRVQCYEESREKRELVVSR